MSSEKEQTTTLSSSNIFGRAVALPESILEELKRYDTAKAANNTKKQTRSNERLTRLLTRLRISLYGNAETPISQELCEAIGAKLDEVIGVFLPALLTHLYTLTFEARKDVVLVFSFLIRRKTADGKYNVVQYIDQTPAILDLLVENFANKEVHVHCAEMLEQCTIFRTLCKRLLSREKTFFTLFRFIGHPEFVICTSAFVVFRALLTTHSSVAASYLESYYDRFFDYFKELLTSGNFVTKQQSTELLSKILIQKSNSKIRSKYVNDQFNLALVMTLLVEETDNNILFNVFNIFKLFVANPKKSPQVSRILFDNKLKIIAFLQHFQEDRVSKEFLSEKQFLLQKLEQLADPGAAGSSSASAQSSAAAASASHSAQALVQSTPISRNKSSHKSSLSNTESGTRRKRSSSRKSRSTNKK